MKKNLENFKNNYMIIISIMSCFLFLVASPLLYSIHFGPGDGDLAKLEEPNSNEDVTNDDLADETELEVTD